MRSSKVKVEMAAVGFKQLFVSGVLLCCCIGAPLAQAKSNGPQGKPFVEIDGQVVELQNDVNELESLTAAITARITGLEIDLQGQIDVLGTEIELANLSITENYAAIQSVTATAADNGFDIEFALAELVRLEQLLETTKNGAEATAADVMQVQDDLALIRDDISQNATGLLAALADIRLQSSLVAELELMTADLTVRIDGKQEDIAGGCSAGHYIGFVGDDGSVTCYPDAFEAAPAGVACGSGEVVTGFNSDGSLKCGAVEQGTAISGFCGFREYMAGIGGNGVIACLPRRKMNTVEVRSAFLSLDNSEREFCNIEVLGACISVQSQLVRGDRIIEARCPQGYQVTGGGFRFVANRGAPVIVASYSLPLINHPFPSGARDAWAVAYSNTSNSATNGFRGEVSAMCVQED